MGTITSVIFIGEGTPKTRIEISGVSLKSDPDIGDVELTQSVLGTNNPDSVTGFGPFKCEVTSVTYNSDRTNVSVRMKDDTDQWTDFVQVK
ncbi:MULTISPECIES: hypothetical protein [Rhizobium]|nr:MULTISPECIES: hypothetical protein [Rhizobium]